MGLTFGLGYEEVDNESQTTGATNLQRNTGYLKYTSGPVTLGYTQAEQTGGTQGHDSHVMEAYCIVFAVNETKSGSQSSLADASIDKTSTPEVIKVDV